MLLHVFPLFAASHSQYRRSHPVLWHGLIPGPWLGEPHCLTLTQTVEAFHVPLVHTVILGVSGGGVCTILTQRCSQGTWTGSQTSCICQATYRSQCHAAAGAPQPPRLWPPSSWPSSIALDLLVPPLQPPASCHLEVEPMVIGWDWGPEPLLRQLLATERSRGNITFS